MFQFQFRSYLGDGAAKRLVDGHTEPSGCRPVHDGDLSPLIDCHNAIRSVVEDRLELAGARHLLAANLAQFLRLVNGGPDRLGP